MISFMRRFAALLAIAAGLLSMTPGLALACACGCGVFDVATGWGWPRHDSDAGMTLAMWGLPEGPFLADVGFGNQTPTAPLEFRPLIEQRTPHDVMRLLPVGDELTLQAKSGDDWQSIYRLSPHPRLPVDFEVANWFTATHPASPFVSHLIVARPGADATRHTLFNGRITVRGPEGRVERFTLDREAEFPDALRNRFGVKLTGDDLAEALAILDRKGTRGAQHPFFG